MKNHKSNNNKKMINTKTKKLNKKMNNHNIYKKMKNKIKIKSH